MPSAMPTIPWTVFFVLEPLSLIAGWLAALLNPLSFATDQIPPTSPLYQSLLAATPHSTVLTLQLGNLYLLMCLMGVGVIVHLKEAWALRNYLIILAIGDLGHLYASVYGLGGLESAADYAGWNQMAWGNVGATVFLFVVRSLTVAGVFGRLGVEGGKGKVA